MLHILISHFLYVHTGATSLSFTEDVSARFAAYGWNTLVVANGDTDFGAIEAAFAQVCHNASKLILYFLKPDIFYLHSSGMPA